MFVEIAIPGSISGYVFDDLNLDQVPDTGEGLNNVSLQLFTDNNQNGVADTGTPIASTTTTLLGTYTFLNVIPGHYVLVETTPPAYISIKDFDATADGDAVPNTNMNNDTLPVSIVNGESDSENFFIDYTACSLTVNNTNDDGYGSFRQVADCAMNGDTIRFNPNLAGQVIEINSDPIEFNIDAVVYSDLSPRVVIASSIQDLFHILPGALMEFHHLIIQSGFGASNAGAAFENHGGLKLIDVDIYKNPALNPGAYLVKSFHFRLLL